MASLFSQRKLTRDEGMILEKTLWEKIYTTKDCIEVFEFLKTYFRKCTNIKNYVPVCPWFDDPDDEVQWGYGFRDYMIAHIKQDFYNKTFGLQDQGKDEEIDTLENRNKFRFNFTNIAKGPILDSFMTMKDWIILLTVRRFPEIGELIKLLSILRSK